MVPPAPRTAPAMEDPSRPILAPPTHHASRRGPRTSQATLTEMLPPTVDPPAAIATARSPRRPHGRPSFPPPVLPRRQRQTGARARCTPGPYIAGCAHRDVRPDRSPSRRFGFASSTSVPLLRVCPRPSARPSLSVRRPPTRQLALTLTPRARARVRSLRAYSLKARAGHRGRSLVSMSTRHNTRQPADGVLGAARRSLYSPITCDYTPRRAGTAHRPLTGHDVEARRRRRCARELRSWPTTWALAFAVSRPKHVLDGERGAVRPAPRASGVNASAQPGPSPRWAPRGNANLDWTLMSRSQTEYVCIYSTRVCVLLGRNGRARLLVSGSAGVPGGPKYALFSPAPAAARAHGGGGASHHSLPLLLPCAHLYLFAAPT